MKESLVMTLIGTDRAGLVQSLSTIIESHGGNWEASRMVQLAGNFAGLLSIEVDADKADALETALSSLDGMSVTVSRGHSDHESEGAMRRLEVVAQDRPGIVRQVTAVIASLGLNIEELETEVGSAPMSGELHFKAEARLWAADASAFDNLRARLEALGAELMVDLKADA